MVAFPVPNRPLLAIAVADRLVCRRGNTFALRRCSFTMTQRPKV